MLSVSENADIRKRATEARQRLMEIAKKSTSNSATGTVTLDPNIICNTGSDRCQTFASRLGVTNSLIRAEEQPQSMFFYGCDILIPAVLHGSMFLLFTCSYIANCIYQYNNSISIMRDFLFLTQWNLTFHIIFNGMEFLSDIFSKFDDLTHSFRAKFFHSIVFPFSMFVCLFFWTLVMINENLVREKPELRCQEWYNHVVHTLVLPLILVQTLTCHHKISSLIETGTITIVTGVIYMCFAFLVGIVFNVWPYEILRLASPSQRICLVVVCASILLLFAQLGRLIHKRIWNH